MAERMSNIISVTYERPLVKSPGTIKLKATAVRKERICYVKADFSPTIDPLKSFLRIKLIDTSYPLKETLE